nr:hypothetical protein HmN_000394900 [Hymenolepis microstoma]
MTSAPQDIETKPAIITELTKMMPRNIDQAVGTPRSTLLPRRETSAVLKPALSFVRQKNVVFYLPQLHPNLKQSSMLGNPVKELDTELFRNDTREFSKEPSDIGDGCNPIHGDIHNFRPEHVTISTRRRNKRKRKTAKPTGTSQQNLLKSVTQQRSPKHRLLRWRIVRRQYYLIHINTFLASKHPNFTKRTEHKLHYFRHPPNQLVSVFTNSIAVYNTTNHQK